MGSGSLPPDTDRAIKDFLASADPGLVRRFVAGDLTLAFAEVNPVVRALAGCSIEDAFARLKAMTAAQRNKYGAPTVVKTSLPKGNALIDRILMDLYGRLYRPPAPAKKTASRTRSPKPATPKITPLSPDDAVRQLHTATTADEARAILGQMKRLVAGFQKVADSFGVVYRKSSNITVLTDGIIDMVLAARRFEPLQRGGMR
jgi:hypothetical protein